MDKQGSATLIVYGELPVFHETDSPDSRVVFDGKLNHRNRRTFEPLLVRELGGLMSLDLRGAQLAELHSLEALSRLLRMRAFSRIVFYGHTITMLTRGALQNRQELALAGPGAYASPKQFFDIVKGTNVQEILIAGCASVSFAAGVSTLASAAGRALQVGGLFFDRHDYAKGNGATVIDFRIGKQAIKWWPKALRSSSP